MFDKNRHSKAIDRRTALKRLGVTSVGLALPATKVAASETSSTTSESSTQNSVSQSSTLLDEDGTVAVDSADIRRLELGSSLEIFDAHDIAGIDETQYYLHLGSCTYNWARFLDGSEDDISLIYNEWHDIDLNHSNIKDPFVPDREDWIGAYEVAESFDDGDQTYAEAVIAGSMSYVTSFVATPYAVAIAMGYSYLSSKSSSSDEYTHFWNWWNAPDGPAYNTSRFSRFSFIIEHGDGAYVSSVLA